MPSPNQQAAERMFKRIHSGPTPKAVAPSPDGRWLAFTEQRTNWGKDRYIDELVMRDLQRGGVRRVTLPGSVAGMKWTPDGQRLLFLARTKPGGNTALHEWNPRNEAPKILVKEKEPTTAFVCGPDGRIYYMVTPKAKPGPASSTVHFPKAPTMAVLKRYPGGKMVGNIDATATSMTINSTGKLLAYAAQPTPYPDTLMGIELRLMALKDGRTRHIGRPSWGVTGCAFSPTDPSTLAVVSRFVPNVYPTRLDLFLVNVRTGAVRNLTGRHDESIQNIIGWNAESNGVYATVYRRTDVAVQQYDLKGNRGESFAGFVHSVGMSNGRPSYCVFSDQHGSARLWNMKRKRPEPRVHGCPQQVVQWHCDGREIDGILVTPLRGKPPYPTVVYVHGGPASPAANNVMQPEPTHALAAAGYAILVPAYRGSNGRGHEFVRANIGDFCLGPWRDCEAGLDLLIARGIADPKRLAIAGLSYGGYMALFAPTQTNRLKASVAMNSIYDAASDAGTTARCTFARTYVGKFPWEAPLLYLDNSASGHVAKLRTPVLLLHGEADTNTPLSNAKEAAYALRTLKREFRFKSYAGEGHSFNKPHVRLDILKEMVAWFAKHL